MTVRERAIEYLRENGPTTAWYIAEAIAASSSAVNHGLEKALRDGEVHYVLVPSGAFHSFRGRVSKEWRVGPARRVGLGLSDDDL